MRRALCLLTQHPILIGPNVARLLKAPCTPPGKSLVHAYIRPELISENFIRRQVSVLKADALELDHWEFLANDLVDGTPVVVMEKQIGLPGRPWAMGFFESSARCIPLFYWCRHLGAVTSHGSTLELPVVDHHFWSSRIRSALHRRQVSGVEYAQNSIYRLFHGSADGIPGLFVDVYGNLVHVTVRGEGALNALYSLRLNLLEVIANPIFHIHAPQLDSGWTHAPQPSNDHPAIENGTVHDMHRDVHVQASTSPDLDGCRLDTRYRGFRAALQYECAGKHVLLVFPGAGYSLNVAAQAKAASILLLENRSGALEHLRPRMLSVLPHPILSEENPYASIQEVDVEAFQVVVVHLPSEALQGETEFQGSFQTFIQHVVQRAQTDAAVFIMFEPSQFDHVQNAVHVASRVLGKRLVITRCFYPGPDYPMDAVGFLSPTPIGLQLTVLV